MKAITDTKLLNFMHNKQVEIMHSESTGKLYITAVTSDGDVIEDQGIALRPVLVRVYQTYYNTVQRRQHVLD